MSFFDRSVVRNMRNVNDWLFQKFTQRALNMSGRVRHYQQLLVLSMCSPSKLLSSAGRTFRNRKFPRKTIVPRLNIDTHQRWNYSGHLLAAFSFVKVLESLGLKSEKNPEIKELTHRAKELLKVFLILTCTSKIPRQVRILMRSA